LFDRLYHLTGRMAVGTASNMRKIAQLMTIDPKAMAI
jgi:hypothetical protein